MRRGLYLRRERRRRAQERRALAAFAEVLGAAEQRVGAPPGSALSLMGCRVLVDPFLPPDVVLMAGRDVVISLRFGKET